MKLKKIVLSLVVLLLMTACVSQNKSSVTPLKPDPTILNGTLENGLTYYVKENQKPENRIELRLIVNAGSVLEDDNQRGLAHFVEHMAFNGTKNFPKDQLIKYLESTGMGFGPEINAYTSFDETVYKLSIPADDPEILKNALLILNDWAHNVSFEDEEIEKERGVIVEEWRTGLGANERYLNKLVPAAFKDSKYAERLTIGDMDVIKNSDPQLLRDFYTKWYRPENIAVAVVGNIDAATIESMLKDSFNYKLDGKSEKRPTFSVPATPGRDVLIIPDPEQPYSEISIFNRKPFFKVDTVEGYRRYINEVLVYLMFNSRMQEITVNENSPFLYAGMQSVGFVRNVGISLVYAQTLNGEIETGLEGLYKEVEKVNQHGFNQDELERAKANITMILENSFNERENIESVNVIEYLTSFFLEGTVLMDIEEEVELLHSFVADISLEEVNNLTSDLLNSDDQVITIAVPDNGFKVPTPIEITNIIEKIEGQKVEKRTDDKETKELFSKELVPGEVVRRDLDETSGVVTVVLDNGITAYLKPTDFKQDEIVFTGISFGGMSQVDDQRFFSGAVATSILSYSGLNGLDRIELQRALTGKNVSISPWISDYTEGFSGSSSKKDLETMLQLLNLYFTAPNFDENAFNVVKKNLKDYVDNFDRDPQTVFSNRVNLILGSENFRAGTFTKDGLESLSLVDAKDIFTERFKDPSDFEFTFTGSFEVDSIIEYIKKYLGSLETYNISEVALDDGVSLPSGVIEEEVVKGIDEQSIVEIIFNGYKDTSLEDEFGLYLLSNYLDEDLRLLVREEEGGTYGVSVFSNVNRYREHKYIFGVYFGCEPSRVSELSNKVLARLEELKEGDFDQEIIDSVIANYNRKMEINLKDNGYWSNSLQEVALMDRDFDEIYDTDTSFITKDYFINLIKSYLNTNQFVKVSLIPE